MTSEDHPWQTFGRRIKLSPFPAKFFGPKIDEEIVLNKDEFPGIAVGDVVEIHHPSTDEEFPRLLLKIGVNSIDHSQLGRPCNKETLFIEKSVADSFHLVGLKDVSVRKVDESDVALDSVELTFKDQYMGRSEMWRVKRKLIDNCVFINKKIEISQGAIRCQVHEMWSQGERVACGIVTSDTKVVFRSPTAMIYLFIQMSSEMWDFDEFGFLYFEKAVDGFLADMFEKWKRYGSSHEVTIVLFSRCFYDATDKNQFPEKMRDCLQLGYNGKFYEDFYRVVVQNERFDDWQPVILQLRKLFTGYKSLILDHHKTGHIDEDSEIPAATISSAAQGNFLEVLNMSLNTFENHYLNRNLDRTGQQSIVITPGVGLFEVDRELMLITKQRIIDSGVGSDLICVGEQPLHAVPLFQLCNKDMLDAPVVADDFSMPHWINLSFYKQPRSLGGKSSIFIPRVKLPTEIEDLLPDGDIFTEDYRPRIEPLPDPESDVDISRHYDDFDSKIFAMPTSRRQIRCSSLAGLKGPVNEWSSNSLSNSMIRRKMSDPDARVSQGESPPFPDKNVPLSRNESHLNFEDTFSSSSMSNNLMTTPLACNLPNQETMSVIEEKEDTGMVESSLMGSIDTSFDHEAIKRCLLRPGRALVNPFDPRNTEVRISSNRRRWTHIFPKSASIPKHMSIESTNGVNSHDASRNYHEDFKAILNNDELEIPYAPPTTGVDWKSLTIPASLPVTTDYFPKKKSLVNDYLVNEYDLTPEEIWNDSQRSPLKRGHLTNEEVFVELISQRLAQGFQIIVFQIGNEPFQQNSVTGNVMPRSNESSDSVWLSIGRLYHRVSLSADKKQIKVTCYRPRAPYPNVAVHYRYRFAAPDNEDYEVSWVDFRTEKLENFNWNRMDFYVCTRGDKEFVLTESLKYWRFRLYAVPMTQFQPFTKKILDETQKHGDIYTVRLFDDQVELTEGFLRFVETCLNRLRRTPVAKKSTVSSLSSPHPGASTAERPRAFTSHTSGSLSGANLQKIRNENANNSMTSTSLGGPLLSPPSRDVCLSTSNVSNEGSTSFESPSILVSSGSETPSGKGEQSTSSLRMTSTLNEILDAMKSTRSGGLNFFTQTNGLQPYTFIAYEAVSWIMEHVEDVCYVENAIKILQNMVDKKFIKHSSGTDNVPFRNGFHFFYIIQPELKQDQSAYYYDVEMFRNDWIEIDVDTGRFLKTSTKMAQDLPNIPDFLDANMERFKERESRITSKSVPFYQCVTIDIDQNMKSERKEWGHLQYQARYNPECAFELTFQWSVATGSIITDLIHGWARKSQTTGFSLIPVPHDPFALPITKNSDPVRGPIFVELDTECLMEKRAFLFEEFPESSWEERMLLFREEIALRFGFVSCITDRGRKKSSSSLFSTDHQYIHCTGNMFLLIPTQVQLQTGIQGFKVKQSTTGCDLAVSRGSRRGNDGTDECKPSKVNRHLTDAKPAYDHSETGFLWSWNFMISKRWKQISNTGATGDISFMDKMLLDFRAFCRNDDNRLKTFWDECWAKKQAQDAKLLGNVDNFSPDA